MDSLFKGLFGNDDDRNQAQDFVSRYEVGDPSEGFTAQEAAQHYNRVAQQVPPDVYQQAAEQAFTRMAPQQRQQFAQMLQQQMGSNVGGHDPRELAQVAAQMQQQQPGGLASLFGGGQQRSSGQRDSGGGIGDMLDSPLAKAALGGIAALAVKHVMDRGDNDRKRKVVV